MAFDPVPRNWRVASAAIDQVCDAIRVGISSDGPVHPLTSQQALQHDVLAPLSRLLQRQLDSKKAVTDLLRMKAALALQESAARMSRVIGEASQCDPEHVAACAGQMLSHWREFIATRASSRPTMLQRRGRAKEVTPEIVAQKLIEKGNPGELTSELMVEICAELNHIGARTLFRRRAEAKALRLLPQAPRIACGSNKAIDPIYSEDDDVRPLDCA